MNQDGSIIRLERLCKTYEVPVRSAGLRAALKSLIHRDVQRAAAVDTISFSIHPGEIVGFLGPNGAGKTTTLKMLSGLLHPTSGEVLVNGFRPYKRERPFLRSIALVMGNRSQLAWDIPVADSLSLFRAIYRIPQPAYRQALDELVELLGLEPLLSKPVRNLSLGERMKCELTAALLHRPAVLFLDEPTLGLDTHSQRRLRTFIAAYNRRQGSTVLLTSHYMADVEALCQRVILIHQGRLWFDGSLSHLFERFTPYKTITVELSDRSDTPLHYGELTADDGVHITFKVPRAETAAVVQRLMSEQQVVDLTIKEPPIDEVIERAFVQEVR